MKKIKFDPDIESRVYKLEETIYRYWVWCSTMTNDKMEKLVKMVRSRDPEMMDLVEKLLKQFENDWEDNLNRWAARRREEHTHKAVNQ